MTLAEFNSSTGIKTTQMSSHLIVSCLVLFYFLFFSHYLLKILSFLSPLFFTTSLLLLTLLTFSFPNQINNSPSHSKVELIFATCHNFLQRLRAKFDEEKEDVVRSLVELEAYRIVFEVEENPVVLGMEPKSEENGVLEMEETIVECCPEGSASTTKRLSWDVEEEVEITGKYLEDFLQAEIKGDDQSENVTEKVEEKEVINTKSNKVDEQPLPPLTVVRSGSNAIASEKINQTVSDDGRDEDTNGIKSKENSGRPGGNHQHHHRSIGNGGAIHDWNNGGNINTGNFGSMKKEKEWKRTLACKLFEERHNVDGNGGGGGEGMDLLWETYANSESKKKNTKKGRKFGGTTSTDDYYYYESDDDEEGEEVEEGNLCCLQAFKFSAGKMNLGMGRPNLVKISKALKGFGWLHQVTSSSSSRHGKKGNNSSTK